MSAARDRDDAFERVRDELQEVDRHVRAALRYSAELPPLENAPVYRALEGVSKAVAAAHGVVRGQHREYRARLAAAESTIPPEDG